MEASGETMTSSLPEASLNYANPTQPQENALAKKMRDTSGRRCLEQYGKFNRHGSWAKTFLGLVNWNGGLVFEEVQADLEAEGYEVQPYVLPAVSVNAPHRRDRVWFVAHSMHYGLHDQSTSTDNRIGQDNQQSGTQRFSTIKGLGDERSSPNSENARRKGKCFCESGQVQSNRRDFKNVTNSNNKGLQRWKNTSDNEETKGSWEQCYNPSGLFRSDFRDFPTQPPICYGDDGLPSELDNITFPKWRNESIKAGGNAIVPQVVHQIFKAIQSYDHDPTRN